MGSLVVEQQRKCLVAWYRKYVITADWPGIWEGPN